MMHGNHACGPATRVPLLGILALGWLVGAGTASFAGGRRAPELDGAGRPRPSGAPSIGALEP